MLIRVRSDKTALSTILTKNDFTFYMPDYTLLLNKLTWDVYEITFTNVSLGYIVLSLFWLLSSDLNFNPKTFPNNIYMLILAFSTIVFTVFGITSVTTFIIDCNILFFRISFSYIYYETFFVCSIDSLWFSNHSYFYLTKPCVWFF